MPDSLLMTKLYVPGPGKYRVERVRLVEKLNRCLEPDCRLALISAPAGFGKTTLISAWLAAQVGGAEHHLAWVSIDEGDNDPVVLWSYIIAAFQTQLAGVGQRTQEMLAAPGGELERKLAPLLNDLAQISQPCILVLDDYHLIRSPAIHRSLAFFVEHAPPHVHLVIASRTDPPLPLALLRGRGQLLEIRMSDLRFSDEDADAYLNAGIGLGLAAISVQALNQKTEGWVAGLQMAALALSDIAQGDKPFTSDPESTTHFIASFSGSHRFILDYLIEEVLNRQLEEIQHFLVQTSILEQLCGPLCDALLQNDEPPTRADAQSILQHLESSNLFIFPLDQQRYWYRYHHLFADLLRKRLAQNAPEAIRELHRRATHWYEENGLAANAIQHAFQMQDFHKAAALIAQITEAMWGRGEHATLLAWMDALPDEEKKRYPHLLTFQVSMLISAGRLKEAEACIPILEGYIQTAIEANPDQSALIGQVSELRTYIASFYGDRPALFEHARTALQHLTRDEDAGKRSGVSLVVGNAHLTEGDLEAAGRAFGEAVAAGRKAGKAHMALSGLANQAVVLGLAGKLTQAAQACQEGMQLITQHGFDHSPMAADIWLAWGGVLCEQGSLAEAETYIQQGLDLANEQQYVWQTARGYLALARLRWVLGDLAGAERAVQAGVAWCAAHQVPAYIASQGEELLAEIRLMAVSPEGGRKEENGAQKAPEAGRSQASAAEMPALVEPLSRREMETLRLIAEGYSNKDIAQKLFISLRTVKYYSTGLYNKLGVDSRMQAVIRARELGLL